MGTKLAVVGSWQFEGEGLEDVSLASHLTYVPRDLGGLGGDTGCAWLRRVACTLQGDPVLFFRVHLLLEETPVACSGSWASQVRVGCSGGIGVSRPLPDWMPGSPSVSPLHHFTFTPQALMRFDIISFFSSRFVASFETGKVWLTGPPSSLGADVPCPTTPAWAFMGFSLLMVLLKCAGILPSWMRQVWVGLPGGVPP